VVTHRDVFFGFGLLTLGGTKCLPGGYFQTILEPGDYTLEVWAPDQSPKWQPLPYSIRAGQLTHVDCLPP
jgi:hypothetical protein